MLVLIYFNNKRLFLKRIILSERHSLETGWMKGDLQPPFIWCRWKMFSMLVTICNCLEIRNTKTELNNHIAQRPLFHPVKGKKRNNCDNTVRAL